MYSMTLYLVGTGEFSTSVEYPGGGL
jgi:hypothetical protein